MIARPFGAVFPLAGFPGGGRMPLVVHAGALAPGATSLGCPPGPEGSGRTGTMRITRRWAGLAGMTVWLVGCGVAPGTLPQPSDGPAGVRTGGLRLAVSIPARPDDPKRPGCDRACTMIGWAGSGPDPNTCADICPDSPAPPPAAGGPLTLPGGPPGPPTTSSVPPGCEERCTASLPPQCQTVCPPGSSGMAPSYWGRGGLQAPWPPPGQWAPGQQPPPDPRVTTPRRLGWGAVPN